MLLVCSDTFSKFMWFISVRKTNTAATISALRKIIFTSFLVPEITASDHVKCYVLWVPKFLLPSGHTAHYNHTLLPKQPHTEWFNWTLKTASHSASHTSWDGKLVWLQATFNIATHDPTHSTPFETIFPFTADSRFLRKWSVHKLLPYKCSPRDLRCKRNVMPTVSTFFSGEWYCSPLENPETFSITWIAVKA